MGKYLKDIYPHATKFQVFRYRFNKFMEKVVVVSVVLGMIYGGFKVGQMTTEANITYAKEEIEVIKEVPVKSKALIMSKIAKCESNDKHYSNNGQVVMRANTNGTVDVGRYQINSVWFTKATELGLDLTKEKDNEAMAYYLYETRGTEDWFSSKKCWK